MKNKLIHFLIFHLLILFSSFSIAQGIFEKKIGNEYQLAKVINGKFKMYVNNCSDTILNKIVSKIIIEKYAISEFSCIAITDSVLLKRIYEVLLSKENLDDKVCFVHSVLYQGKAYYSCVLIFTEGNFKKYIKKKEKEQVYVGNLTGEINIRHEATLFKYANCYSIMDRDDSLIIDDIK
jgi:hypothetical protein